MAHFESRVRFRIATLLTGLFSAALFLHAAAADLPYLSPIFGDHMVLQRGKSNIFWGWTKPGDVVTVEIAGHSAKATAGPDGRWEARLQPPDQSGACSVKISGSKTIELQDVLIGDVWLCGGQSNMELPLSRTRNAEAEIRAADHPSVRLFTVKSHPAYAPSHLLQGTWKVCSPRSVTEEGGFSAVGYYFAQKIQSATNVTIGLIQDCLGGTPAESWTSAGALRKLKDFDEGLAEVERLHSKGGPEYGNYISHWYDEYDVGQKENWASPNLNDKDWKTVSLSSGFRDLGVPDAPSVCYFRKQLNLPDPLPTGPAFVRLGVLERMDTTQINGQWVGASAWVENPRVYMVKQGVLKPGRNLICVRVLKTKSDGGFKSKGEDLKLVLGDKSEIPLGGEWKGKLSVNAKPPHPLPIGFENWPTMPAVLYNGMIAPLAPLAICGALWYQGEANASHAAQYRTLLPAMISDWRGTFQQGDFPFYIVSLAAFMQHKDTPGDDWWAELREAQAMTAATLPNSGLALTIDVGDANDIHPKDKKPVGERLGLWALAKHYGLNLPCSGPTFARVEQRSGALKLSFKHTDGGLVVKGDKLAEFAVCGDDRKWHWAEAKLDGDSVIVSSEEVPEPKFARYAWQSNPKATLFNGAGLPAVPFRTDQ